MNNLLCTLSFGHFGCPKVKAGQQWIDDSNDDVTINVKNTESYIVDRVENGYVYWHYAWDFEKDLYMTKETDFVYIRTLIR